MKEQQVRFKKNIGQYMFKTGLMFILCFLLCLGYSVKTEAANTIPAPKSVKVTSDGGEAKASWKSVEVTLPQEDGNDYVSVSYEWEAVDANGWSYDSGSVFSNEVIFSPREAMASNTFRVRTEVYYEINDENGYRQEYGYLYSDWTEKKFNTGLTAPYYLYIYENDITTLELDFPTVMGYGYQIYRKAEGDSKYTKIKTVKKAESSYAYYLDKNLTPGRMYYYKVRYYKKDTGEVSKFSQTASYKLLPHSTYLDVKIHTASSLSLSWYQADSKATGYKIYRSENENSGFKSIKTISKISTTKYTDKGLIEGKTYYYKIKVYVKTKDSYIFSEDSNISGRKVCMGPPEISKFEAQSISKMKITLKPVEGTDGYKLYCSESYDGEYKTIKTFKGDGNLTTVRTGQKHGQAYFYKTRSFKYNQDGSVSFSPYSDIISHYQDYYGYDNEDYDSKCMRAFNKSSRVRFTSAKEAEANMKTIKVKVWDIDSRGKKYSKTMSLKCLKGLAPTIKRIFEEIYEGDEKFPIHSLGCYSWRGDSSSSEHCEGMAMDINPDENYCVYDNGTIDAGSYWRPGKDPYSIRPDGDVVTIMRKYGFSWGLWSSKKDYMHFSYFGG